MFGRGPVGRAVGRVGRDAGGAVGAQVGGVVGGVVRGAVGGVVGAQVGGAVRRVRDALRPGDDFGEAKVGQANTERGI